jgi:hypothetical protein
MARNLNAYSFFLVRRRGRAEDIVGGEPVVRTTLGVLDDVFRDINIR